MFNSTKMEMYSSYVMGKTVSTNGGNYLIWALPMSFIYINKCQSFL